MIDVPDLPQAWTAPYLALVDTVRVLIVVECLYLVYLLAYYAFVARSWQQRATGVAFMLAVVLSVWTQIERIGRPLSWRLPVAAVMATLGVWGALRFMSGGHRLRDLTFSSLFRPPVVPPQIPPDMERRLRRRPMPEPEREDPP